MCGAREMIGARSAGLKRAAPPARVGAPQNGHLGRGAPDPSRRSAPAWRGPDQPGTELSAPADIRRILAAASG